jgi:hypothetical protein
MANVSKGTADRLGYSNAVRAAIEVNGGGVAKKAEEALFAKKPKDVDLVAFVETLGTLLKASEEELERADADHAAELADDDPLREERDLAQRELIDALLNARAMITGAYGASFAKRVGLTDALPERPDLLQTQARNAVSLLRRTKKPGVAFAQSKVELGSVADAIEPKSDRLKDLLSSLKREQREAEKTLVARDQAAERWDGVVSLAGAVMEQLARVAGEHEIADRVKPTERRRAGIVEEDPGTPVSAEPTGGEPA